MSAASSEAISSQLLTRIMDDVLLNTQLSPRAPFEFFRTVASRAASESVPWDENVVFGHWSWLQRTGVIVLTGIRGGATQHLPPGVAPIEQLYVTPRGRKLLQSGDASPHNPIRFDAKIRSGVTSPDEIIMAYVDEAVGAWAAGLDRATAVMIGCACERLILLLAQSLAAAQIDHWSESVGKLLDRAAKSPVSISKIFQKVRETLLDLAGRKRLPGGIADALDRKLTPIFEHARGLRNKSGHPTAVEVSHDGAEAVLLLFPGFYSFVDQVMSALADLGESGSDALGGRGDFDS